MTPLKTLLTEAMIEKLASRSYLRYGKQIVKDGDVSILESNTFNVFAKVQHAQGEKRSVELHSTPKGFKFKCTCTNRKDLFCQHCVAVALAQITN